ncbi:hypothetical protein L596_028029 [Steinernema carpocapsae]|uniref:BZIP domain-containing protein n=1 Tax=Steinernema carpocapsae TaxID=34508 RepID=A0A4U5LXB3_STECR|nr:hypothetical protein L596_028029 [Steinernema carpocapsae]
MQRETVKRKKSTTFKSDSAKQSKKLRSAPNKENEDPREDEGRNSEHSTWTPPDSPVLRERLKKAFETGGIPISSDMEEATLLEVEVDIAKQRKARMERKEEVKQRQAEASKRYEVNSRCIDRLKEKAALKREIERLQGLLEDSRSTT